jgi:hypothetical protein
VAVSTISSREGDVTALRDGHAGIVEPRPAEVGTASGIHSPFPAGIPVRSEAER